MLIKEDYARAGVPMLPVVRGERATVVQIACYAVLTVGDLGGAAAAAGAERALGGRVALPGAAVLLNAVLLRAEPAALPAAGPPRASSLFQYSMVYLALLFLAMAVDRAHGSEASGHGTPLATDAKAELMAKIFHPSTNTISKLSIVGVLVLAIPVGSASWHAYAFNLSYVHAT